MEPDKTVKEQSQGKFESLHKVTPLSKYLALTLFIVLPFLGAWIGYTYTPEKIVTQKIEVIKAVAIEKSQDEIVISKNITSYSPEKESKLSSLIKASYNEEQWSSTTERVKDVLLQINADFINEISFDTFSFQGVEGEVVHYCYTGDIILTRYGSPLCLGSNIIVIEWDGDVEVVVEKETPSQDGLFTLNEIFLNEGKFEKITESSADEATLLLLTDELSCLGIYGEVCFYGYSLSYAVTLPDLQVSKIEDIRLVGYDTNRLTSYIAKWSLAESFYWNQPGSKAVFRTPCPAGCPDAIYEGFDLNEQMATLLLNRTDGYYNGKYGGKPVDDELDWISENDIQLGSTLLSF